MVWMSHPANVIIHHCLSYVIIHHCLSYLIIHHYVSYVIIHHYLSYVIIHHYLSDGGLGPTLCLLDESVLHRAENFKLVLNMFHSLEY